MKVLVTGATGFLGSHLTDALVKKGYKVKALVRKTSNTLLLEKLGVELGYGDITDGSSLLPIFKDCEIVYHCAAKVSDWGSPQDFSQLNVEGTENILKASLKTGVKRLIHVSSLTVLGITKNHWKSDESHPYPDKFFESYTKTKVLSEKLVRKYYENEGLPVVIIRPSIIWGPGDTIILPRLVRLLKSGKFFFIGKGNQIVCLSYVSNLVDALLLAGSKNEAIGEIYNITDDEKITFKEFIEELAKALDLDPPKRSLPFSLAYGIAYLLELWGKITRAETPPLLTRYGVCLASINAVFDISKARKELGYEPRINFREGLKKTKPWLRKIMEADNVGN
jgi:nucleoside-diphosphate-sugar epimerase